MKFYYRVQSRGQSDCSKMPDDSVIMPTSGGLVMLMPGQEICATAEDAAGNLSEPETISTANP